MFLGFFGQLLKWTGIWGVRLPIGHVSTLKQATSSKVKYSLNTLLTAALAGSASAATLTVTNGNFNAGLWNSNGATKNPAGWTQSLTTAGNYGQTSTATPNLSSIAAHFQDRNNNYYVKNLTTDNAGLDLSDYSSYTVGFDYGHRNDSATTTVGTFYLDIALWDLTNNVQVGSTQTVNITSTGQRTPLANQNLFTSGSVTFNFDNSIYTTESVGIRFTHAGTSAGADGSQTFNATILLDNVSVTAIPEPTAALLGGFGLLSLLRRRR